MTAAMPDQAKDSLLQIIPAGRMGSVQDIAETVAFLASEKAAYITGQTIQVDGGMGI
jgi:3-oxoacyl-[acyl-carrier protein] reductase